MENTLMFPIPAKEIQDDIQPGFFVWGNPFAEPNNIITKQALMGSKGVYFMTVCRAVPTIKPAEVYKPEIPD